MLYSDPVHSFNKTKVEKRKEILLETIQDLEGNVSEKVKKMSSLKLLDYKNEALVNRKMRD